MGLNFKSGSIGTGMGCNPFIAMVLWFFVTACSREVNIRLPVDPPMAVLNSMMANDSLVYVRLTQSVPAGFPDGTNYAVLKNATVKLFADDQWIGTLEGITINDVFYYRSREKINGTRTYRITATAPELKAEVSGSVTMPQKPLIRSASFTTEKDAFNNTIRTIKLTLKDAAKVRDFYRLRVYPYNGGSLKKSEMLYFTISNLKVEGGGIFDDFVEEEQSREAIINDELFNGKTFTLNIKSRWGGNADSLQVELAGISESAYLYYKSARLQDRTKDDPLYEKVPVYSNITNGMGIIGAFNMTVVDCKPE